MVERTDDHPGTGSATYCSAVSLRQASRTLVLAQRSYANNATTSSCMRISPGLGQGIVGIAGQTTHVSLLDLSKCIAPGSRYRDSAGAAKTAKKIRLKATLRPHGRPRQEPARQCEKTPDLPIPFLFPLSCIILLCVKRHR